ncbi:MAG: hypothetical protein AAFV86_10890, partial [Pseudomonadota bacterium]
MTRSVPIWLVLLLVLVFAVTLIVYGRLVATAAADPDRASGPGKAALAVAEFPTLIRRTLEEVGKIATEVAEGRDRQWRTGQPIDDGIAGPGFETLASAVDADLHLPVFRADRDRLARGWRMLYLYAGRDGNLENAAILLDPDLRAVKYWHLDVAGEPEVENQEEFSRFVHGADILPDGSLFYGFDNSPVIRRIDSCGETVWSTPGNYHHSLTIEEGGHTILTL